MNIDKLKGIHFVADEEVESQITQMVNEIIENNQVGDRNTETLRRNVSTGASMETVFASLTGGTINRNVHNSRIPETFAWDVEVGEERFEIKSGGSPKATWFNFNLNGYMDDIPNLLPAVNLTTFLKYSEYVDFIVVGNSEKVEGGYNVSFKWVMDAKTFNQYIRQSQPNPRYKQSTHFYHIKNAIHSGACFTV